MIRVWDPITDQLSGLGYDATCVTVTPGQPSDYHNPQMSGIQKQLFSDVWSLLNMYLSPNILFIWLRHKETCSIIYFKIRSDLHKEHGALPKQHPHMSGWHYSPCHTSEIWNDTLHCAGIMRDSKTCLPTHHLPPQSRWLHFITQSLTSASTLGSPGPQLVKEAASCVSDQT